MISAEFSHALQDQFMCVLLQYHEYDTDLSCLITSRVGSRGHRIGAVSVSVCVPLCVSALSRPNRLTYDLDF